MQRDLEARAAEVLQQALEIPAEKRPAFVRQACGRNVELFSLVMNRLETVEESPDMATATLPTKTITTEFDGGAGSGPVDGIGETIGPYRLIRRLGEGGMGAVFLAQQERPIRRQVALKLIKLGMDSARVLQRFDTERRTLSKLKHPYIAQVFDAGSSDRGQPYFVMEHVEGMPITSYCDAHRLPLRDRLLLFCKTCEALQHAHQKGVIHRDIKPSNIMVTEHEGKPVPKIIDFGIAKAISGDELQTHTELDLTRPDVVIGTLGYMSPEQSRITDADVDTRTDVYSLGVLLYELLVGRLPLEPAEFRQAAWDELFRLIRERQPERPSSRISTLGEDSQEIARRRQMGVSQLRKRLSGDLDWIILKALEKDKERRYGTPADFAADVFRYLDHLPVEAGPPSGWYRVRKFVRRNRASVTGAALVLLSLIAGIVGTSLGFLRAREEAENATETIKLLREFLSSVDPKEKGKDLKVRELLEAFEPRLSEVEKPEIRASLFLTYAQTYAGLGLYDQAFEYARTAVDVRTQLYGLHHPQVLTAKNDLSTMFYYLGKFDQAEAIQREILQKKMARLGKDHPSVLTSLGNLAELLVEQGKYEEAEAMNRNVIEKSRRVRGEDHPFTLSTMHRLAVILLELGKYEESESVSRELLTKYHRVLGREHPDTLSAMHILARILSNQERLAEAEEMFRDVIDKSNRVLGEDHPSTLSAMDVLSNVLLDRGKLEEGEAIKRDLLEKSTELLGREHPNTLVIMNNLATCLADQKKYQEAEGVNRDVHEICRRTLGADHPHTLISLCNLGNAIRCQGRYAEAIVMLRDVVARIQPTLGDDHRYTLTCMHRLALALEKHGELAEAEQIFRYELENNEGVFGLDHRKTLLAMNGLARTLEKLGRRDEAVALFRESAERGSRSARKALKRLGIEN